MTKLAMKLMRVAYKTDVSDDEPEYIGSFSDVIPASALEGSRQIVHVDWSVRGEVEVTFLIPA